MDTERSFPRWEILNHGGGLDSQISQLVEQRNKFLSQLKERLTIPKAAASFLKASTQRQAISAIPLQELRPIESIEKFHLTVQAEEHFDGDTETKFHTICKKWEPNPWIHPEKVTEGTIFKKEVLQITAEVKVFLKTCFYTDPGLEKPQTLEFEKENTKFYIEFEERKREDAIEKSCVSIPDAIPILKKSDQEYLDEVLGITSEFPIITNTRELPSQLTKKSDFIIPLVEKLGEPLEPPHTYTFERWEPTEIISNDLQRRKSLERYLLEEELEKGVEYRLKAPFMDERPTFGEPTSVVDFIDISQRFPCYQTGDLACAKFSDLTKGIDESILLSEVIKPTSVMGPAIMCDTPERIDEENPYLIHIIPPESQETSGIPKRSIRSQNNKRPAMVSDNIDLHQDTVETPGVTFLQNSNIQLNPPGKSDINSQTTDFTQLSTVEADTTLNATKMLTTNHEITQRLVTERTIDDDLDEIIQRKRKTLFESTQRKKNSKHKLVDILLSNSSERRNHEEILEDTTVEEDDAKEAEKIILFDLKETCDNLVVFNSSFTSRKLNSSILKHLDKATELNITETDLGGNDVDLILSPTNGLLIFPFSKCQQTNINGDLLIQDIVIPNKMKYKKLHVLIISDILDKPEDLLYIQTCLSIMDLDVIITDPSIENICGWICTLSTYYGEKLEHLDLNVIPVRISFSLTYNISNTHSCL